jgi:hypothetical protein
LGAPTHALAVIVLGSSFAGVKGQIEIIRYALSRRKHSRRWQASRTPRSRKSFGWRSHTTLTAGAKIRNSRTVFAGAWSALKSFWDLGSVEGHCDAAYEAKDKARRGQGRDEHRRCRSRARRVTIAHPYPDEPSKPLTLLGSAATEAEAFLARRPDVAGQMERVSQLIDGFEDSYGMELLSTVHWVICHEPGARDSADDAIAGVRNWSVRKGRTMKADHIRKAWERLKALRWDSEARSALH